MFPGIYNCLKGLRIHGKTKLYVNCQEMFLLTIVAIYVINSVLLANKM